MKLTRRMVKRKSTMAKMLFDCEQANRQMDITSLHSYQQFRSKFQMDDVQQLFALPKWMICALRWIRLIYYCFYFDRFVCVTIITIKTLLRCWLWTDKVNKFTNGPGTKYYLDQKRCVEWMEWKLSGINEENEMARNGQTGYLGRRSDDRQDEKGEKWVGGRRGRMGWNGMAHHLLCQRKQLFDDLEMEEARVWYACAGREKGMNDDWLTSWWWWVDEQVKKTPFCWQLRTNNGLWEERLIIWQERNKFVNRIYWWLTHVEHIMVDDAWDVGSFVSIFFALFFQTIQISNTNFNGKWWQIKSVCLNVLVCVSSPLLPPPPSLHHLLPLSDEAGCSAAGAAAAVPFCRFLYMLYAAAPTTPSNAPANAPFTRLEVARFLIDKISAFPLSGSFAATASGEFKLSNGVGTEMQIGRSKSWLRSRKQ